MRKPVVCAVLFCALVVFIDRALAWTAGWVVARSRNPFVMMYERRNSADLLFLGNSRVDRNIDVRLVEQASGLKALNLGLGGNHALISEALYRDYVDRYGPPKVVIIELGQTIIDPNSIGEMLLFTRYSERMAALLKRQKPVYHFFQSVFHSLTYNNDTFWRVSWDTVTVPPSRLLENQLPVEVVRRWEQARTIQFPILPENLAAVQRMVAYARSTGSQVRLVIAPYWEGYKRLIVNYDTWESSIKSSVGGEMIWDYSELLSGQPQCFHDEGHLNVQGARAFVDALVADRAFAVTPEGR